jgi:hypothetical protein
MACIIPKLCLIVEDISYEDFMVRPLFTPAKIDALLLDKVAELVYTWLESVLASSFGPVFRLCTTAFPFSSPLAAVTEANLMRFLDAAKKYGAVSFG